MHDGDGGHGGVRRGVPDEAVVTGKSEEAAKGKGCGKDDRGFDRKKPWIPDAFSGHSCPICLGLTEESAMIGSCRHIFCERCLFQVRSMIVSNGNGRVHGTCLFLL